MAKHLTDDKKKKILAQYHAGKSQNSLAKIHECSTATINKLCKGIIPKNVEKVNTLTTIETELAAQNEQEVNAVRLEVAERTKHLQFFDNHIVKNVAKTMKKVGDETSINEHKMVSEILKTSKEAVCGKPAESAGITNNTVNMIKMGRDELIRLARG